MSKETISDYAKRMRELSGLSEGVKKSIKTIQEGVSKLHENESENESAKESDDDFDTHDIKQIDIEENSVDELYTLNENSILVLDFLEEETQKESSDPEVRNSNDRKGPKDSATWHKEGKRMTGEDGNMWTIKTASNGVNRWIKDTLGQ